MIAPFENESFVRWNQYPTMATATARAIRFETISMKALVMGCIVVDSSSTICVGLSPSHSYHVGRARVRLFAAVTILARRWLSLLRRLDEPSNYDAYH